MSQDKAKSHHSRALSQYASIQGDLSGTIANPDSVQELSHQAMAQLNPNYKEQMTNELLNEEAIHNIIRNNNRNRDNPNRTGQMYEAIEKAMKQFFDDEVDISNMAERVMTQIIKEAEDQPLLNKNENTGYGTGNTQTMSINEMKQQQQQQQTRNYNYHLGDSGTSDDDEELDRQVQETVEQGRRRVSELIHIEDSLMSFLDDPREAHRMAQEILMSVMKTEPLENDDNGIIGTDTNNYQIIPYENTEQELLFLMDPGYRPPTNAIEMSNVTAGQGMATQTQGTFNNNNRTTNTNKNVSHFDNNNNNNNNNNNSFKSGFNAGLASVGVHNGIDVNTPSSVSTAAATAGRRDSHSNISGYYPPSSSSAIDVGVGTQDMGVGTGGNNWINDPSAAEEMMDDPQVKQATRSHKRKVSLFNAIKTTMHHKFDNADEANAMASNVMKEILWTKDMTNELVTDNSVRTAIKHHKRKISLFKAVKDTMSETFSNDPIWADKMARSVMKQIVANKELAKDLIVNDTAVKEIQKKHKRKISMFNALKSEMSMKYDDPKKAQMMAQQVMKEIVAQKKQIQASQKKRGSVDLSKDDDDEKDKRKDGKAEQDDDDNNNNENEEDYDLISLKSDDSMYDFLDNLNSEMKEKSDEAKIENLLSNNANVQLEMLTHARKASTFQGLKNVLTEQLEDSKEGTRLARKIMKKLVEDQKAHGMVGFGTGSRDEAPYQINGNKNENEEDRDNTDDEIDEKATRLRNQFNELVGKYEERQVVIDSQNEKMAQQKDEIVKTKQELIACYTIIKLQNEELQKLKTELDELKHKKRILARQANASMEKMRQLIKQHGNN